MCNTDHINAINSIHCAYKYVAHQHLKHLHTAAYEKIMCIYYINKAHAPYTLRVSIEFCFCSVVVNIIECAR